MSDKEKFDRIAGHYYAQKHIENQKRLADASEVNAGIYRPRRSRLFWVILIGMTFWTLIDPESAIPFIRGTIEFTYWAVVTIAELIKDNIESYDWGSILNS